VKGGHRGVVEALLKRYADVDIPGKEKKTATYTAVEKGHIPILKLLLSANPDLEVQTKVSPRKLHLLLNFLNFSYLLIFPHIFSEFLIIFVIFSYLF